MSEMEGHGASKSITMGGAGAPPLVGELSDVKPALKGMFLVPFLLIMTAAIGFVTDLPVGLPRHELLSIAYAAANFVTFTLGLAFLFVYIRFPWLPILVVVTEKLVLVAAGLGHLALGLMSKFISVRAAVTPPLVGELADVELAEKMFKSSILAIMVGAIGIVAGLPVGLPHHELLSIAYAMANFATFAFSMALLFLSFLFPPMPVSISVAKKLVWIAVGLIHLSLGLGIAIHAIF